MRYTLDMPSKYSRLDSFSLVSRQSDFDYIDAETT